MFRIYKNAQSLVSSTRVSKNLLRLESTTSNNTEKNSTQTTTATKTDKNETNIKKNAPKSPKTFAKLFKESKFVSLGDLENKVLVGRIVDVNGDDLYIDYGGKFNCVCKKPERNPHLYARNANVKIKLKSFEMASYFLNSAKHITLLESDAELFGLYDPRINEDDDQRVVSFKKEIKQLNLEPKHY